MNDTLTDAELREILEYAFQNELGEEVLLYIMRALFDFSAFAGTLG